MIFILSQKAVLFIYLQTFFHRLNLELSPHMKSPRLCRGIITGAIQYCCFASTTRAMTVQRLMFGRSYGATAAPMPVMNMARESKPLIHFFMSFPPFDSIAHMN